MSTENDVPLGDGSRRYYEQQFGDRIRQVKKGGGSVPAGSGGGSGFNGRAGCGVLIAGFFILRVIIALIGSGSRSSTYNDTPTFTPPNFNAKIPEQRDDPLFADDKFFKQQNPFMPLAAQEAEKALLTDEDVPLPAGLCYRIYQESLRPEAAPGKHLMKLLDPDARKLLVKSANGQPLDGDEREELLDGLNDVLQHPNFWNVASFAKVPAVLLFVRTRRDALLGDESLPRVIDRRGVLELCYPEQIVPVNERNNLNAPSREEWKRRALLDLEQARKQFKR